MGRVVNGGTVGDQVMVATLMEAYCFDTGGWVIVDGGYSGYPTLHLHNLCGVMGGNRILGSLQV